MTWKKISAFVNGFERCHWTHKEEVLEMYRELMKEALERTKEWGLECLSTQRMETALQSRPSEQLICRHEETQRAFTSMSREIPIPLEHRANSCIATHLLAAKLLLSADDYPMVPMITIGDVVWKGDACFKVTEESLRSLIDTDSTLSEGIGIHAWLTFPDMTILDFTLMPWQRRQDKKPMDLREIGGLKILNSPGRLRGFLDYHPMLIGPKFLWETAGGDSNHDREEFEKLESAWAHQQGLC